MKKWLKSLIIVFLVSGSISVSADPVVVVFQNRIQSPSMGFFDSTVPVTIGLYEDEDSDPIWHEYHREVVFEKGYFRVQMGSIDQDANPLLPEHFHVANLKIGVQVFDESFFFPMSSIPYAVRVFQAEEVVNASAESMVPGTAIQNATMNAGIIVGNNSLHVHSGYNTVGVNLIPKNSLYDVDVGGLLNADNLRVNGTPLLQTFSWQPSPLNQENIFFNGAEDQGSVGIGTRTPLFRLHVNGGINATDFVRDSSRLSAGLDWQQSGDDLYFKNMESKVGIGEPEPVERLEVNGGMLIGNTSSELENIPSGTIMWTGSDYLGYDGEELLSLVGVRGTGAANRVSFFRGADQLGSSLSFFYRDGNLGLGSQFPSARIFVDPEEGDLMRVSSGNHSVLFISEDGRVVLGRARVPETAFIDINGFTDPDDATAKTVSLTVWNELHDEGILTQNGLISDSFDVSVVPDLLSVSDTDTEAEIISIIDTYRTGRPSDEALLSLGPSVSLDDMKLKVYGNVNADEVLMHGLPIRFSISKGTYFISDRQSFDTQEANIFYLKSDVSIGQPETESLFQIASPFDLEDDDVSTKDPAVTFRFVDEDGDKTAYTLGIDADNDDLLRVENSDKLGAANPLFVMKENFFGLGTDLPEANLHVSGDLGVVFAGQFDFDYPFGDTVTEGQKLNVDTSGTMFFFKPDKAAFRVGRSTVESPTLGEDYFSENIGEFSNALGYNLIASGNYANALGGTMHVVNGAYSTAMGGNTNLIDGFFSLGLGTQTRILDHHHGAFVWGDTAFTGAAVKTTETSKENQFLIRASTGVGIGTNEANAALVVKAHPVLKSDFLSILPDDTTDLDASIEIFDALVADGYLDTDGDFLDFMPRFEMNDTFFVTPVEYKVATQDVYDYLVTQYRAGNTVLEADLRALLSLNTTDIALGQALWEIQAKLDAGYEIWVALVNEGIIKSSGNVFANSPAGFTHENADDDSDLYTYLMDRYNSGPNHPTDPSVPISTSELANLVDDDEYDAAAFSAWTDEVALYQAARQLYLGLVARSYIKKSGALNAFLPIFDFDDTEFNGQSNVATEDIFAVLMTKYDQSIVQGNGVDDVDVIEFSNQGNINLNPSVETRAPLYMDKGFSIGRTDTPAQISLRSLESDTDEPAVASNNYAFAVFNQSSKVTPSFVVNHKGMVGVKAFHDKKESGPFKEEDNVLLFVDGAVIASSFEFATGETLSVKDPVIVFEFEDTTPNIYFLTGNVGIGTLSPNSLLELSNIDGRDPAITFDLLDGEEGVDHYTMGIEQEEDVFRIGAQAFYDTVSSNIVITQEQYVGLFTDSPEYPLHVSGSMIASGSVVVASRDARGGFTTDVLGAGALTIENSTVLRWLDSGDDSIYSPSNGLDVGIGAPSSITAAEEGIDVYGTTKAEDVIVTGLFHAKSGFQSHYLDLDAGYLDGRLHVSDGDLLMLYGGAELNVSNVMSSGRSLGGKMVGWTEEDLEVLQEVGITWTENPAKESVEDGEVHYEPNSPAWLYDEDAGTWVYNTYYDYSEPGHILVSRNMSVARATRVGTLQVDNTITMGVDQGQYGQNIKSQITYDGYYFDKTFSHSVVSTNVNVETDVDDGKEVVAHSITLSNGNDKLGNKTYLTTQATAYGLRSDVSDVVAQIGGPTTKGYKFPALFLGDVGIGHMPSRDDDLADDKYVIDVKGTVSAESFNISERLLITTINAASKTLIVDTDGNVGIGTDTPQSKLDIRGTVLADNIVVTTGVTAPVINIHSDSFVVNSDGFVGIGTTVPRGNTSQFEIFRSVTKMPDDDIYFQRIMADFSHDTEIEADYTAMGIRLSSLSESNVLGRVLGDGLAKGIDVDLTKLNAEAGATVVGVQVDMATSNAAVFVGGMVGIGTTEPNGDFALDVAGTLRAINATGDVSFLTDPHGGKFSHLVITENLRIGDNDSGSMTAKRVYVRDSLSFPGLSIEGVSEFNLGLHADNLLADELIVTRGITLNAGVVIETLASAPGLLIDNRAAIGYTTLKSYDLAVLGGTKVDTVTVNDTVYLGSFLANNDVKVRYNANARLGIGTDAPQNAVDVQFPETFTEYIVSDNTTWDAVVIQGGNADRGSATGISFQHTEEDTPAILAVRSSETISSGSHLVFITDDEAMRIMQNGNVGIGVITADMKLSVVGDAEISDDAAVLLTTNVLELSQASTSLTFASDVYLPVTLNAEAFYEGDHLRLYAVSEIVTQDSEIGFNFNPATGELVYSQELQSGIPITGEISKEFAFSGNEIPYIGSSYAMTASDMLKWVEGPYVDTLHLGTSVNVVNMLTSLNAQSFTAERVSMAFTDRTAAGSDRFVGVSIVATGSALDDVDVVRGVDVDLSELRADSEFIVEGVTTRTDGFKYAALFDGGAVAIVVSDNVFPQVSTSQLYIRSGVTGNAALAVVNSFYVTSNGSVGIGGVNSLSQFTVSGSAQSELVALRDTSLTPFFLIQQGVGIGTTDISNALHVNGTLTANNMVASGASLDTLVVSDPSHFIVTETGTGIGISNPTALLDVKRSVNGTVTRPTVQENDILLSSTYTSDLQALVLRHSSEENNTFGGGETATGLKVRLTELKANVDTTVIGLMSQVTGNQIAGRFIGDVGIGTTTPEHDLHVVGSLKGRHFFPLSDVPDLVVQDATVNSLVLNGDTQIDEALVVADGYRVYIEHLIFKDHEADFNLEEEVGRQVGLTMDDMFAEDGRLMVKYALVSTLDSKGVSLNVDGDSYVKGNVDLGSRRLYLDHGITYDSDIRVSANIYVDGALHAGNSLSASKVNLPQIADQSASSEYAALYVDAEGDLYYVFDTGTEVIEDNLSQALTGTRNRMVYFDGTAFKSVEDVSFRTDTFEVGSANYVPVLSDGDAAYSLQVGVSGNTLSGQTAYSINPLFLRRIKGLESNDGTLDFSALHLGVSGDVTLGSSDRLTGLVVNLENLIADSQSENGEQILDGDKIAALFLGGAVMIASTENVFERGASSANLHIINDTVSNLGFKVSGRRLDTLVVTGNGRVGLGVADASAGLEISRNAGIMPLYVHKDDVALFAVDTSVLIGSSEAQGDLVVGGDVTGNYLHATAVSVNALQIGDAGTFRVNSAGQVLMGVESSTAQAEFYRVVSGADAPFVQQQSRISIRSNREDNLAGINVSFSEADDNVFGGSTAKGLRIRMGDLVAHDDARIVGVYSTANASAIAARFMGGNVGIGTTTPEVALDVKGTIEANNFVTLSDTSPELFLQNATINNLIVLQNATMPNTTLFVENQSKLIVDELRFARQTTPVNFLEQIGNLSSLEMDELLATRTVVMATLNVGVIDRNYVENAAFNVEGEAVFHAGTTIPDSARLTVNMLTADSDVYVYADLFATGVAINGSLRTPLLQLQPTDDVGTLLSYPKVYVDEADGELKAGKNVSDIAVLSVIHSGVPGVVPYFDSDGSLKSSTSHLFWESGALSSFTVGDKHSDLDLDTGDALLDVKSTMLSDTPRGNYALQSLSYLFDRRVTESDSEFVGMDVLVTANYDAFPLRDKTGVNTPFDKAVGFKVDMRGLSENSTTQLPLSGDRLIAGNKYAALFFGGGVGIATSGNYDDLGDSAFLHVSANARSLGMMVESQDSKGRFYTSIIVTSDGRVSIATENIVAQLGATSLAVKAADGSDILHVSENVRLNSQTGALLGVASSGDSPFRVDYASEAYNLFVSSTGEVGIYQPSPEATLHIGSSGSSLFQVETASDINSTDYTDALQSNTNLIQNVTSAVGGYSILQEFTPLHDGSLTGILIALSKSGSEDSPDIQIDIYEKGGALLSTQTISPYLPNAGVVVQYNVTLPTPIDVDTGTDYEVRIIHTGKDFQVRYTDAGVNTGLYFEGSSSATGQIRLSLKTSETLENGLQKIWETMADGSTRIGDFTGGQQAALNMQSNLMVGDASYAASQVPTSYQKGLIGIQNSKMISMGLRDLGFDSEPENSDALSSVMYSGNRFAISHGSNAVEAPNIQFSHFSNRPHIGIFTQYPSWNFQVTSLGVQDALFVGSSPTYNFRMDDEGNIKLGTAINDALFSISGNIESGGVINSVTGGTRFKTSSFNVSNTNGNSPGIMSMDVLVGNLANLTVKDIKLTLDEDMRGNDMVGMDISLDSGSYTYTTDDSGDRAYGLRIDVSNLAVQDPTFVSNNAFKAAAAFTSYAGEGEQQVIDVKVGIGTSKPQAPIDVRTMDRGGSATALGDIATFVATRNPLEGLSTEERGSGFTIRAYAAQQHMDDYYDSGSFDPIVTNLAFTPIVFTRIGQTGAIETVDIDREESNLIFQELQSQTNPVIKTDGTIDVSDHLGKAWYTRLNNYYGGDLGLYVPSRNIYRVLKQYVDRSVIGLVVHDEDNASVDYPTVLIATGRSIKAGENKFGGHVSIGVGDIYAAGNLSGEDTYETLFQEALQINGDMRIGTTKNVGLIDAPGEETLLYFSGGPKFGTSELLDSDNGDILTIQRENYDLDRNRLKVSIGESELAADAEFSVGVQDATGDFDKLFTVRAFANEKSDPFGLTPDGVYDPDITLGMVGFGHNEPVAPMHVKGSVTGADSISVEYRISETVAVDTTIKDHLAVWENTAYSNDLDPGEPNTLLLSYAAADINESTNFMTFMIKSGLDGYYQSLGAVEGMEVPSDLGIEGAVLAYSSPERDYAEYIEKMNPSDEFKEGDIVGIFAGKVSHKTEGADQIMAVSSTPIVVGNWPGKNEVDNYVLVAFLGQVPVNVKGVVHKGDFIVPSGKEDGTAVAVSPSAVDAHVIDRIVGRSWDFSDDAEVKSINTLVGFPFEVQSIEIQLAEAKQQIDSLEKFNDVLDNELQDKYEKRQRQLNLLREQIKELKR